MFSGCNTLQELNARRRELQAQGKSAVEVNSAYNKARKELMMASTPDYRVLTKEPCIVPAKQVYGTYVHNGACAANEIAVIGEEVYI